MKTLVFSIILVSAVSAMDQTALPDWAKDGLSKVETEYKLKGYLTPVFLEADFSGDGRTDIAVLIERKNDLKKGIVILFKDGDKPFILGAGDKFSTAGDNFDWADSWSLFQEKETIETPFKEDGDVEGSKKVVLKRPAIKIRQNEGSGGLIYYDGKRFVWIHQGD